MPLISLTFFLLLAGAWPHAPLTARGEPEPSHTICPAITVSCPDTLPRPGLPLDLTLKVSGAGPSPSLTYRLTVSAGQITSGSGGVITTSDAERAATVDTTGLSGNSQVTVTVEVSGLDRSCVNRASCTTTVLRAPEAHPLDSYGDIPYEDEQARLDNFAIEVQNNPDLNGYIVCYGGSGRGGGAAARCARAKRYLAGRRGLAPDRLVLVDGGYDESLRVRLWLLPPGTVLLAAPAVAPSEAEFAGTAKGQRRSPARRRRPRTPASKTTP